MENLKSGSRENKHLGLVGKENNSERLDDPIQIQYWVQFQSSSQPHYNGTDERTDRNESNKSRKKKSGRSTHEKGRKAMVLSSGVVTTGRNCKEIQIKNHRKWRCQHQVLSWIGISLREIVIITDFAFVVLFGKNHFLFVFFFFVRFDLNFYFVFIQRTD